MVTKVCNYMPKDIPSFKIPKAAWFCTFRKGKYLRVFWDETLPCFIFKQLAKKV